jgi:hypothetical protein
MRKQPSPLPDGPALQADARESAPVLMLQVLAIKSRVGALYTFGQPRVGDYEVRSSCQQQRCAHTHVRLLAKSFWMLPSRAGIQQTQSARCSSSTHSSSSSRTYTPIARNHLLTPTPCFTAPHIPTLLPSSLLLLLLLLLPLQFLCHLQVSLLEPSKAADANSTSPAGAVAHSTGHKAAVNSEAGAGGHHTEHAMTASGASKLRGLLKGHQEQDTAPPLTSRYIRVVNTFDVSAGVAVVWASLLT